MNAEIATEKAIVSENCRYSRPVVPEMNATGTNTAQIANVVAITARPISSVPTCDACLWPRPRWMWRTMFSRTTIASSMSRPMQSDSAIIVMKLSVKPNR